MASGPQDEPASGPGESTPQVTFRPPVAPAEFAPIRADAAVTGPAYGAEPLTPRSPRPAEARRSAASWPDFRELPVLLLVAFVLALLIKTFLVQAFYIPSESMDPTLQVVTGSWSTSSSYHFHPPRRGTSSCSRIPIRR